MKPSLVIRKAHAEDAPLAALLIRQATGPMTDVLFGHGSPERALQILEGLFIRTDNRFSHQYVFIAEESRRSVGLLLSHPAGDMSRLDLGTGFFLVKSLGAAGLVRLVFRLLPLAGSREARRGEYYIAAISVLDEFQGLGIGSRLLQLADEQAIRSGLSKCSLTVALDNESAQRLYLRHGYRIVETRRFNAWQRQVGDEGYHRMVKLL